jgi:hypothetical protein
MATPEPNDMNIKPEWYEPFPEPQTFPDGWDMSELTTNPWPGTAPTEGDQAED